MKYCPRCNFTFADSHHVCDFDGAELIGVSEQRSNGERPSFLRRCLKSPVLLAAVGLSAVVSSAFLIGYYEVVNQTTSIVRTEASPPLSANALPPAQDAQPPAPKKTALPAKTRSSTAESSTRRQRTASATVARIRRQPRNAAKGSEVARRTESQPPGKKDPVLTAMLKTTWRVLKKPFSF